MKRLIKSELYGNENILEKIFYNIYNEYKNNTRQMKAYKRDKNDNDPELFIYLPKGDTFDLILPYIDPPDNLFGYQIVTFGYSELFKEDIEQAFKEIFLKRISNGFDTMYIERTNI